MIVAESLPYPWPFDGALEPAATALVVAGWDAGWAARVQQEQAPMVLTRLAVLTSLVALTISVAHPARSGHSAPTPTVDPPRIPAARSILAAGVDGFYGSSLDAVLRHAGIRFLLVAGLGLEGPVHSTMRDANDRGYECLLLSDAVAPVDPSLVPAALSSIHMSGGIFGATGTVAAVAAALRPPALGVSIP